MLLNADRDNTYMQTIHHSSVTLHIHNFEKIDFQQMPG